MIFSLFKAQLGNLNLCEVPFIYSSSLYSNWELAQTVLALYVRVLNTLYLVDNLWWLSQWRYWSVWVGFLLTVLQVVLSGPGETEVPRIGMDLSVSGSLTVNHM